MLSNPLIRMIAQRLALGIVLLFAISLVIFIGTEMLPGDVAQSILGQSATEQSLANLREELGLNQPAYVRYLDWVGGILQGDLGTSLTNKQDIGSMIGTRLGNTFFLASVAAVMSVPLAVLLGMIAVHYKDGFIDKAISMSTLGAISLPEFFIGYLLIYFVAVQLGWFPSNALVHSGMSLMEKLYAVALPATTLTLVVLAHMMRMTRAAILNVMSSAYVETAELKGLSSFKIIFHHAFPNAIAPIITVVMLNLGYLVVGVVVVEVIFVYPGMGQLMVDHVIKRDMPVVQACGLIFAATYILLNMTADILAIIANPRLRHPK
ncbi:ABC transporter permease [Aestuariispira insulae]|uniref:Peptide/nickel transport system permease protein n=1 Tax=Aestuariispira insulae TaxID=1461337 RepID=A0A3D9HXZ8_9PROT|nr:ABC transporter permease [Aestuariispira insulae]RED54373.1 peptide/nickel transport system permease protein [Aestuariispira insulae]